MQKTTHKNYHSYGNKIIKENRDKKVIKTKNEKEK